MTPENTPAATPQSTSNSTMVTDGLNLWLEMKDPRMMPKLLLELAGVKGVIDKALNDLHYVHFARFLPARNGQALQVITSFDGDFRAYVLDFVLAIADQFDLILGYVRDWPPPGTPAVPPYRVKDHPAEFLQFVTKNDLRRDADGAGGIGLYSAYPNRTVIDIVGASRTAPPFVEPPDIKVDLTDVQANVLRSVGARHGWHVGLQFGSAEEARALLAELMTGSNGAPQVSDGTTRLGEKDSPTYALTVGLTYSGLTKLGISESDRAAFALAHHPFVQGPDKRDIAIAVGDIGTSAPAYWEFGASYPVDMVVSLYAAEEGDVSKVIADQSERLLGRFEAHDVSLVQRPMLTHLLRPGDTPKHHTEHFGYIDGSSQPRLAIPSTPLRKSDVQPRAGVGEFLLGANYPNVFGGKNSLGGLSPELAENATFAAMRIMEQDVAAFERLLDYACDSSQGVEREWVAAKLMGRWRDGTPLEPPPDQPIPGDTYSSAQRRNLFDYSPSAKYPDYPDDSRGLRCPVGAHARRMNPRSATVAGRAHSRRLLRRGMSYGPLYEGKKDNEKRGLVGLFLCADLERQYEFILRQWAQGDRATSGIVGQQDPIIGAQSEVAENCPMTGEYRIPRKDADDLVLEMPRLVKTVGSVYLFVPGLEALRLLAGVPSARSAKPAQSMLNSANQAGAPDPATFDPRAREFRDEPFGVYRQLRASQRVVPLPLMESTWAFSYKDVNEIACKQDLFLKRQIDDKTPVGLLFMDGSAHKGCRENIQPLFKEVLEKIRLDLKDMVEQCYAKNCKNKGQARAIDWVAQFAKPVAHAVFFDLFGLKQSTWMIRPIEDILALATPAEDEEARREVAAKKKKFGEDLLPHLSKDRFDPSRLAGRILEMSTWHDPESNTGAAAPPLSGLELERLSNAAVMCLAGVQTVQWFISLAAWHLLENKGELLQQIKSFTNRQVIDELLRFDTPIPFSDRYVAKDTSIGDVPLVKKQRLTLAWASANRDETKFGPNADRIDFTRDNELHLAFGNPTGDNYCLGRELVYEVMNHVLNVLRTADPVPRLAEDFKPLWGTPSEGAMFRAMVALQVHS
jgi:cytochrome P450/deferrochelatase/peroxidase EfeB